MGIVEHYKNLARQREDVLSSIKIRYEPEVVEEAVSKRTDVHLHKESSSTAHPNSQYARVEELEIAPENTGQEDLPQYTEPILMRLATAKRKHSVIKKPPIECVVE